MARTGLESAGLELYVKTQVNMYVDSHCRGVHCDCSLGLQSSCVTCLLNAVEKILKKSSQFSFSYIKFTPAKAMNVCACVYDQSISAHIMLQESHYLAAPHQ